MTSDARPWGSPRSSQHPRPSLVESNWGALINNPGKTETESRGPETEPGSVEKELGVHGRHGTQNYGRCLAAWWPYHTKRPADIDSLSVLAADSDFAKCY